MSRIMVMSNFKEPQPSEDSSLERKPSILVVDDHPTILNGTINVICSEHPEANILKTQTAQETLSSIQSHQFDLVVMDLSIPDRIGESAKIELGIQLLRNLLQEYPQQNFLVQTSYVKALIRIRHEIDNHQGGFAIADKALPENEMLMRVNLALMGAAHTKDIKTGIELKSEWLNVLRLAFEESLTDKVIAERMYKSERSVRTYWTKIQDVLGVYPEDCRQSGKNMRIHTEVRAREEGLID